MEKELISLSCFNGFGGLALVLDSLGIESKVYSSEIDKHAIVAAQALYPDTSQIGDITKWREWDIDLSTIDVVAGGSPCQGFSSAGKQGATKAILDGVELLISTRGQYLDAKEKGAEFLSQSYLFWEFILLLDYVKSLNPSVKFMLENVKMKGEYTKLITDAISVEPNLIDSGDFSGQRRKRNYWSNITPPIVSAKSDRRACEYIDHSVQKANSAGWQKWWVKNEEFQLKKSYSCILNDVDKSITQTARQVASWNASLVRNKDGSLRFFTPKEAARLQGVPEHKIDTLVNCGVSNTQLYKMLGNGWQLDTVKHVLHGLTNNI